MGSAKQAVLLSQANLFFDTLAEHQDRAWALSLRAKKRMSRVKRRESEAKVTLEL